MNQTPQNPLVPLLKVVRQQHKLVLANTAAVAALTLVMMEQFPELVDAFEQARKAGEDSPEMRSGRALIAQIDAYIRSVEPSDAG